MSKKPADEPTGTAASTPAAEDDVRAKFREALDRKNGQGAPGSGDGSGEGGSKASGATSNHKVQREFRRKSGG